MFYLVVAIFMETHEVIVRYGTFLNDKSLSLVKKVAMPSVELQSKIKIELNEIIQSVAQLDTPLLEEFVDQLTLLLARRKAPHLPIKEAELLLKIHQWLPPDIERPYDELTKKRREQTITTEEYETLLRLVDIVEMQQVERMKNLIELSKIRGVSLDELMEQLGLTPPSYV